MESLWLKNYPKGIAHTIQDPLEFETLGEMVSKCCQKYKNLPAFSCMGTTLSFSTIERHSNLLANFLTQTLKLLPGDRMAIMMPNILQYPVLLFAAFKAGITVVNVNPLYTERELKYQLCDSGTKAIFILENFAHTLSNIVKDTPIKHVVLTKLGDLLSFPKSWLTNFVVQYVKKLIPPFHFENPFHFSKILSTTSDKLKTFPDITKNAIAFLQYTGGTTGVSKGAILTHENILSNIAQASLWIGPKLKEGDEIIITPLPLYHIFSLMANCLVFLKYGGHNVLITNPRDTKGFIEILNRYPFTGITAVNTLFNALIQHESFKHLDFSHLSLALGGGMAVQGPVAEKWKNITGCAIAQAYGLTETSPAVCINPLNKKDFNGSVGFPLPSTAISIRDEHDKEMPVGETGELWIKGPQVMKGYWEKPEETAQVFSKDGWLKTGDIAKVDEKGYVYIVDRKKDMIVISGFKVFPNEIEEVLIEHSGILEVAALGVEDEKSGEAIKIFIVKKDESLTEKDVLAYCRQQFTGYKIPKYIEFRKELPKSNVGKILRRLLR